MDSAGVFKIASDTRRPKIKVRGGKSVDSMNSKRKTCSGLSRVGKKSRYMNERMKAEVGSGRDIGEMGTMKRKEDEGVRGDFDLTDAAAALTKLGRLERMSSLVSSASSIPTTYPPLPRWSGRRKRSAVKWVDLPTTVSDNLPVRQVSESSSSGVGDSQSALTVVKAEDPCSSQEEEPQRFHKLVSDSSNVSAQPDSRIGSPISPLPVLRTDEFTSAGVSNFEGSGSVRSAFHRVVPVRPVKKAPACRKLKVEERLFEASKPEQAADVRHLSRKKPRPVAVGQLAPVKLEEPEDFCRLTLAPSLAAAEEVKKQEETIIIVPDAAVVDTAVKLDPVFIKVETRLSGRFGQRTGGKRKPVLSEGEKEARKQRRVQANRESARQTIRRKQVLCEEYSKKAQLLSTENETIRKEVELMQQKCNRLSEMNVQLAEEVERIASIHERGPTSIVEKPSGLVQLPMPPHLAGLTFHPWYVGELATQAPGTLLSGDAAVDYASALATAVRNNSSRVWIGPGQSALLPLICPQQPMSSVTNDLPSSSAELTATYCPLTRSVSLPVVPGDTSRSLSNSGTERALTSVKPLASYRSCNFAESSLVPLDLRPTGVIKCNTSPQQSPFSSRAHYFSSAVPGMVVSGMGSVLVQNPREGNCLPMSKNSWQPFGRAYSTAASNPRELLNSRCPMFASGSGGMLMAQEHPAQRELESQRVAAAATEARRRRRELTRAKFLQHRPAARLPEPSGS